MKIMLINGSPHKDGCIRRALEECEKVLNENGVETEWLWIGTQPVQGCIDCGKCAETGRCVFNDKVNEIIDKLDALDGFIVGSPVYYGGTSGQLNCLLDRLFFSAGGRMAGKIGAAVVSCRRGGASAAFARLNKYFEMSNMPIPTSQYWNQVHGFTPEDVEKDEEGLQTMRTLAQNTVWLLKSIEAGRKAGVRYPEYEERMWTHFIME